MLTQQLRQQPVRLIINENMLLPPLPHDTRVQQFKVFNMVFSTGNLIQLLLLKQLLPHVHVTSPLSKSDLQLNQDGKTALDTLAETILQPPAHYNDLRDLYRESYAAAASTLSPIVDCDEDDKNLPKEIALEIANFYYINLELTLGNVKSIITKKLQEHGKNYSDLTDAFIDKIVHAGVDNDLYQLQMLLPDKNFIKAAVESLKGNNDYRADVNPSNSITARVKKWWNSLWNRNNTPPPPDDLNSLKQTVSRILGKYITWWKGSWFGHHHNDRARAVRSAIQNSNSDTEIKAILERQQIIMAPQTMNLNRIVISDWKNDRWNNPANVKTINANPETSGYYRAVSEACDKVSQFSCRR